MKYEVRVQLKPDVLNVEAKEILSAINNSGFPNVSMVQTSKIFTIELSDTNEDTVHKIAEGILTNNVIEDFSITKINV